MKLFELEALEEGIAAMRNIKGICVLINQHLIDRAEYHEIPWDVIDKLLKKVPDLRNKFKTLGENTKFNVWSKSMNYGIGLRKRLDRDGWPRVEAMTAIKNLYDEGSTVVYYVG